MPRQRDHVFRLQSCFLLPYYYIRYGYSFYCRHRQINICRFPFSLKLCYDVFVANVNNCRVPSSAFTTLRNDNKTQNILSKLRHCYRSASNLEMGNVTCKNWPTHFICSRGSRSHQFSYTGFPVDSNQPPEIEILVLILEFFVSTIRVAGAGVFGWSRSQIFF